MTDKKLVDNVKKQQKIGECLSRSPAPAQSQTLFASLDDAQNALPEWVLSSNADDLMKRSAGRPKGAENIIGRKMRDYYFAKGLPNPLIQMGQILNMTPIELSAYLECTILEAFIQLQKVREAAAKFLIPVASTPVDADGNALPQVMIINTMQTPQKSTNTGTNPSTPWEDNITIIEAQNE